ncbi:FecCD family ABC transporter permease [Falsirhodobacter halotolerans]|uniref:FecCD family ABC transporter permease n=1 Tax=Falsirhodobacter halotolerans TaxID=1146892 RepID=UPI001FD21C70|nr:iron ABC transporter permease [Falsirhodobacter halotolerans]MCJ8139264.1 iron ABC transporter permease [Falsirhodobacter halotolerans]
MTKGHLGWMAVILAGGAALVLTMALAVSVGEAPIPLRAVFAAVSNGVIGTDLPVDRMEAGIIWHYRLSRAIVTACCGGALALSGAVLQALLRNPLAEPYLLGISAGASTGAVAVMVLGVGAGTIGLSMGALVGAVAAFAFVVLLAQGAGGGIERIILAGIAGSQLFNAATSFIVTTSASAEQARGVMFWLLGGLGGIRWPDVWVAVPVVVLGLALCLRHARALDAFAFGEEAAASLGVAVGRLRVILFAVTALMTGVMVSLVGAVGFVGLVVPHAVRFLTGADHMRLLPACVGAGAIFMVLADILSRIIVPGQVVPIGVVTALFGAPVFTLILLGTRRG